MRHHIHQLILNKLAQRAESRYLKDPSDHNMRQWIKSKDKLHIHRNYGREPKNLK